MFDNNNTIGRGGGDGGGDDHDYQPLDDRALDVQILPQHLRMTYGDNVSPPTTSAPFNRPREYRELREITAGQQIVGVLFGAFLTVGVCWLAYQGRLSEQRIMEREERIRQEEIEKQSRERVERRKAVQDLIERNGLSTVLTEKNFPKRNGTATSRPRLAPKTDKRTKNTETPTTSVDLELGHPEVSSGAPQHDQDETILVLPISSETTIRDENSSSSRQLRPVERICAICLEPYQVGDAVVWSMNKGCKHVFDLECFLDYFMHSQDGESAPCPCCRKEFLVPPDDGGDSNKDDKNDEYVDDGNITGDEQDG